MPVSASSSPAPRAGTPGSRGAGRGAPTAEGRPLLAASQAPGSTGRRPLSCLIVDDSACFLRAARALLEREGLSVAVATSAKEGLHLAEALQPDVVLVDIVLGDEDGFELARQLAGDRHGQGPSVVLTSTHAEAEFADLIDQSPADGFLPKAELSTDALCRIYRQREPGQALATPGQDG